MNTANGLPSKYTSGFSDSGRHRDDLLQCLGANVLRTEAITPLTGGTSISLPHFQDSINVLMDCPADEQLIIDPS
jgi:hypothetical protein